MGRDREDIFVIKWFMEFMPKGISLFGGYPHTADVWYWKENRTDPVGYADDKIQYLQTEQKKRAVKITASDGKVFYLVRKDDKGNTTYKTKLVVD